MKREKIYGISQRITHWQIAICVVVLIVLGTIQSNMEPNEIKKQLQVWHLFWGRMLLVSLMIRILLLMIGPKHARIKKIWFPKAWLDTFLLRSHSSLANETQVFGHNIKASLTYLMVYLLLVINGLTGLIMHATKDEEGFFAKVFYADTQWYDWCYPLHAYSRWFFLLFICLHLLGMIHFEYKHKIPIIQSMFSGFQYRRINKGE